MQKSAADNYFHFANGYQTFIFNQTFRQTLFQTRTSCSRNPLAATLQTEKQQIIMPLRAFVNGQEKISICYSDDEWISIKEGIKTDSVKIILPCCQQHGFLRTSSKGLKHFIHAKGQNSCDWKPETPEHLKAKVEVVNACIENGWKAIPEHSENDWRADVLAVKNDARIAFEIQWSSQTAATTQFRQDRYKESKVRGCWFFRTVPKEYRKWKDNYYAIKEIPFFKINKSDDDSMIVNFNKSELPIGDFVSSLLNKQIKFCENYRAETNQEIEIVFFETSCWRCHEIQHLYTVDTRIQSRCKTEMYLESEMWDNKGIDKHPNVIKAVLEIVKANPEFKIGTVKNRFSKTAFHRFLSFGCYSCDVILGDFHLQTEKMEALNGPRNHTFKVKVDLGTVTEEGHHWCYSPEHKHCV
ncbi:MAG: hypothetical protein HY062_04835 [Bacteroidetes bacterium]|nr:hypothetical protein [Bacteroidota bacterium]